MPVPSEMMKTVLCIASWVVAVLGLDSFIGETVLKSLGSVVQCDAT